MLCHHFSGLCCTFHVCERWRFVAIVGVPEYVASTTTSLAAILQRRRRFGAALGGGFSGGCCALCWILVQRCCCFNCFFAGGLGPCRRGVWRFPARAFGENVNSARTGAFNLLEPSRAPTPRASPSTHAETSLVVVRALEHLFGRLRLCRLCRPQAAYPRVIRAVGDEIVRPLLVRWALVHRRARGRWRLVTSGRHRPRRVPIRLRQAHVAAVDRTLDGGGRPRDS